MNIFDRIEDILYWAATAILTACAGGAWWLLRLLFTNQQQIELIRADLAHRVIQREEDREQMAEIKTSVGAIEQLLMKRGKDAD